MAHRLARDSRSRPCSPCDDDAPGRVRVEAEDRLRDLGAAGADEPGQPERLRRRERENETSRKPAGLLRPSTRSSSGTGRRLDVRGEVLVEPPADHQLDQRGSSSDAIGCVAT